MPISDILNCAESDLWAILDSDDAYENVGWFKCKGIGMIELCKLGEMLGIAPADELMSEFNLIGEPRDDGPWPQIIPCQLLDRIANLSDVELVSVASKWGYIEEFDGATTFESLSDYLTRLRRFLIGRSGTYFLVNAL
jgi:hypothetical protein